MLRNLDYWFCGYEIRGGGSKAPLASLKDPLYRAQLEGRNFVVYMLPPSGAHTRRQFSSIKEICLPMHFFLFQQIFFIDNNVPNYFQLRKLLRGFVSKSDRICSNNDQRGNGAIAEGGSFATRPALFLHKVLICCKKYQLDLQT